MQRERRTLSVPSISFEDVDHHPNQDLETHLDQHQNQREHNLLGAPSIQLAGLGGPPVAHSAWAPHSQPPSLHSSIGHGQMQSLGRLPTVQRSRSASASSASGPGGAPSASSQKKKIVTACLRCRTRKIRCDGTLPACRSCVKAGVDCIEVDRSGDNNMPRR